VYLLPAVVFVSFSRPNANSKISLLAAGLIGVAVIASVYYLAASNLELAAKLLFLNGKNPNSDYGMFSARHIGDMLQLLFCFAPQILIILFLLLSQTIKAEFQKAITLLLVMSICGIAALWLIDPVHSIVLDFPKLLAYFAPIQLVTIVLLVSGTTDHIRQKIAAVSLVSLFVFLSWFSLNRNILNTQEYAESYFRQHDNFYMTGSFAFRDALFAIDEKTVADDWDRKPSLKSPEYIDLQGCQSLALRNENTEALRELYKIIANHPYWGDPRYMLAGIQMKLNRPQLAAPELDTALMLEPYNKSYLIAKYSLYRDTRAYSNALATIRQTLQTYPSDSLVLSDYMIVSYRAGDIPRSDSLRKVLREQFPNLPYPLFIEGLIAEGRGDLKQAERAYQRFIDMAPNDPDVPRVRKMLNDVVLKQRDSLR
jgi:tetratricopeptide (TPR) repeat protein